MIYQNRISIFAFYDTHGNHKLSFDLGQADEIIKLFEAAGIIILQNAVEDCNGVIIGSISGNSLIDDKDIPKDLDILNFILKASLQWHLFGHIHATEGQRFQLGETICQNISVFNSL